jgi:hypothetical protein
MFQRALFLMCLSFPLCFASFSTDLDILAKRMAIALKVLTPQLPRNLLLQSLILF